MLKKRNKPAVQDNALASLHPLTNPLADMFREQNGEKSLRAFTTFCHDAAVTAGWWDDLQTGERVKRSWGEVIALAQSETAEALEATRKNLNDDKLPHRKGMEVELADLAIRAGDTVEGFGFGEGVAYHFGATVGSANKVIARFERFSEVVAELNLTLSRAYESGRKEPDCSVLFFAILFNQLVAINKHFDLDIGGAIIEKLEFNANRSDHKRENRLLADGKQF